MIGNIGANDPAGYGSDHEDVPLRQEVNSVRWSAIYSRNPIAIENAVGDENIAEASFPSITEESHRTTTSREVPGANGGKRPCPEDAAVRKVGASVESFPHLLEPVKYFATATNSSCVLLGPAPRGGSVSPRGTPGRLALPVQATNSVSVREQIKSFESVSSRLLKSGDPLLNPLNLLPLFSPFTELGAPDVDQGKSSSL